MRKLVSSDERGLQGFEISVNLVLCVVRCDEDWDVFHSCGREMNVSRQTLSSYLMYLEQAFLVRKLYNYSPSRRKVERKLRRYYPTVMSADLLFSSDEISKSKVFEGTIVNQLQAEFFWRDPYKNEVDVVLTNRRPLPVEIKYGRVDLGGLQVFARRFKIDKAYVISDSNEETRKLNEKTISVVPCYKFLLTA